MLTSHPISELFSLRQFKVYTTDLDMTEDSETSAASQGTGSPEIVQPSSLTLSALSLSMSARDSLFIANGDYP